MLVGGIIGTSVFIFGPAIKAGPPELPEPPLVGELQDFAQQYLPLLLLGLPGFWLLVLALFACMVWPMLTFQTSRTNHPIERWLIAFCLLWFGPVSLGAGLALMIGSAINGEEIGAAFAPVVTLITAALLWYWPSLRPGPLKLILTRRWLAGRLKRDPPLWWVGGLFFVGLVSFYAAARNDSPYYAGPVVVAGMILLMAAISAGYAWLGVWLTRMLATYGVERQQWAT